MIQRLLRLFSVHASAPLALILALTLTTATLSATAQTSLEKPDLSEPTLIAPDYFGPNAFPIPDMLDGTTLSNLKVEISTDYFAGHRGDQTYDFALKAICPLFSDRVNLTLWVSAVSEWYVMSDESHAHSRLTDDIAKRGQEFGDAYLSTDIHLMQQTDRRPDISLRVALKSALGYGYFKARYYDTPGYFFDTSVAKSLKFDNDRLNELRFVATLGFLCWQTDNGRQNDATMYGLQVKLSGKRYTLSQSWGGYCGWENAGDRPMSIKTEFRYKLGSYEPLIYLQHGLHDYPYTQLKIGLAYLF
ncbi:MAG: hypothetical protein SNG14_05185 [Rikenellaceae bacterium]